MSSSEDGISQSSKKKKHNRRRFLRIFRLPYRNSRSSKKREDPETGVTAPNTDGLQQDSSLSGDLASLAASSRGDAVTIGSMPLDGSGLGQTGLNADCKSVGKQSMTSDPTQMDCPLCLNTQPIENFPQLTMCNHRSCMDCLRQYLTIEITESRVSLSCPECQEKIHPVDVQLILKEFPHLIEKWEEFLLRRCLSIDPDCRWCPAPDCGFAVIATGCADCPKIHCERPGCDTCFCYHCRQEWHPDQTCDSAHLTRTRLPRLRSSSVIMSRQQSLQGEIKPCPKCSALISKMNDGSCNHINCTVCGADFCWLCLQEITELHYLSPSGCTFWGTKPWSRKKKILWQLGLLIGAPLGIGLVAGVGVPAILIGFPIWVARRAMQTYASKAACKRRGIVVACVAVSIIAAPILAALAVGVGVPCMLLYVYGVVPFSICRNGCYGGPTRDAAERARNTLRIDLVSPNVPSIAALQNAFDSVSLPGPGARGAKQANLSIGEASVGGLTMLSYTGSQASAENRIDADRASTTAIAGASITGSITGSTAATIEAAGGRPKDPDQISANGPNVTSVQIHMRDDVSVHSASSYTPSTSSATGKSYPSKSFGSKRKSQKVKVSTARKSSMPRKISEEVPGCATNCSSTCAGSGDADLSPDAADARKPVVVDMVSPDNGPAPRPQLTEDSGSASSGTSSYGSHHALVDQVSPVDVKKSEATAILKKDKIATLTIDDECRNSKKAKKQCATKL